MSGPARQLSLLTITLLAISLLAVSCKKKSEDNKDAGVITGSPLMDELRSKVFSMAHGFREVDKPNSLHNLDGTKRKALIYFETHGSNKKTLNFLKVVQDSVTGLHEVFGGRARFSDATTMKMITDYHCSRATLAPGATLDTVFAQMKQCSTAPDLGVTADKGAPDASAGDLSAADLSAVDASGGDASAADAAGPADSSTGDISASGSGYTLEVDKTVKNRFYVRGKGLVLSRVMRKNPSGMKPLTVELLNVWERVAHASSCDPYKPREHLLLYADDQGKLLYAKVVDYYDKSDTYAVEEGTIKLVANEMTLDPVFTAECGSAFQLNPSKLPIFPVNLWLSDPKCTKQSASQERYYYTKTDRKCGSTIVTELNLKGVTPRVYISRKNTAFPATRGSAAHKLWSMIR